MYNTNMPNVIGICGLGVVGNAIYQFLKPITGHTVCTFDKYKKGDIRCASASESGGMGSSGSWQDLLITDLLFICLPTPFLASTQAYDTQEIDEVLRSLAESQYSGSILLKSTVDPSYCVTQNAKYPGLKLWHNPEFLSAQTAVLDFAQQRHIILGYTPQSDSYTSSVAEFYQDLFPFAELSVVPASVAGVTKLACNAFYAVKIQYFTEIYALCEKLECPYTDVVRLMLKNGWISPHHTQVPGPDQQISYGGACFPKDVAALNGFLQKLALPHGVLSAVQEEQHAMRG